MTTRTFSIGGIAVDPNLILAPMSGVTNICFRRLIRDENPNALGLVVTEFISIEGLTRQNLRSLQMMRFRQDEHPISIQIFGHDVNRMIESAKMVEDAGADILDINSGCPVPKVVRRGGGCELMRQPEHMAKLLTAVRKNISIPLTLKIRSGWDETSKNAIEIAKMAEDCGIAMLAVHGRTRKMLYRGAADWNLVAQVAQSVSIPVVGSGDVVDFDSFQLVEQLGCAGVMIGRGALSNPWIFSEIQARRSGVPYERPNDLATPDVLERYSEYLREELPDKAVIGKLKQFASQVTRRVKGSARARRALCQSSSVEEFLEVLDQWREYLHLGNRAGETESRFSAHSLPSESKAATQEPVETESAHAAN